MRKTSSLDEQYFEDLYAQRPDPWSFETSSYERTKYEATLDALGPDRYASALEVGCSIGVLTAQLAARCDALLATDISQRALEQARRRCADQPQVRFQKVDQAGTAPRGAFDLVVLSEVLYYWSLSDLSAFAGALRPSLSSGARLLLVHWTGLTDYPLSADEAVDAFRRALEPEVSEERARRKAEYRLDLWRWSAGA